MKHIKKRILWMVAAAVVLAAVTLYFVFGNPAERDTLTTLESTETISTADTTETETQTAAETSAATTTIQRTTAASSSQTDKTPAATKAETTLATTVQSAPVVTDISYKDSNIQITITEYREHDTTIYVADVVLSDISYLKTAFAGDYYSENIVTAKTSVIAAENNAILAINGDFCNGSSSGYILRNGVLYRSTSRSASQENLVIGKDGSFEITTEGYVSAQSLANRGAWQVFTFGPGLVENGAIAVTEDEEVARAMSSNPRTAIGIIDKLHYVFVVSDGRTSANTGLSLYQLAEFMQSLGASTSYNLDGGGSATMVFNGSIVNQPTTDGKKITERAVSDIVYIGL